MGPLLDGWTEVDAEAVIARGDPADLLYVPIVVGMDPPDCEWAASVCVRLAVHPDEQVRANAVLGLGHLSRVCGRLNESVVRPLVEAGLRDPSAVVRGHADSAADDLGVFLGWQFDRGWLRTRGSRPGLRAAAPPGLGTSEPRSGDGS